MLNIHSIGAQTLHDASAARNIAPPPDSQLRVKDAFQDFVAGTFYAQMLKSLHKSHGKPAYFHGGQAEEIFRGQMDQQIAEDLARRHGAAIAEPLFAPFLRQLDAKSQPG